MTTTATVETLTAEVRVLMVGNRQVTKGVYQQLDIADPWHINPFGRVNAGTSYEDGYGAKQLYSLELVGEHEGTLVRCGIKDIWTYGQIPGIRMPSRPTEDERKRYEESCKQWKPLWIKRYNEFLELPLIVLAGLR